MQTWIDERLFGWSKSPHRGGSAWAGSTPSGPASGSATPDHELSDDEDHGDYDHVIGVLNGHDVASTSPRQSRSSSFADLQRLRMTAEKSKSAGTSSPNLPTKVPNVVPQAPPPDPHAEGNCIRSSPRSRKHSLTDTVQVERIASEDTARSFKEVTQCINKELHPEGDPK
jgi:glycerol-3-phosphate O-acyltransferase/dihydroxyacetone phosphate acyltransferase